MELGPIVLAGLVPSGVPGFCGGRFVKVEEANGRFLSEALWFHSTKDDLMKTTIRSWLLVATAVSAVVACSSGEVPEGIAPDDTVAPIDVDASSPTPEEGSTAEEAAVIEQSLASEDDMAAAAEEWLTSGEYTEEEEAVFAKYGIDPEDAGRVWDEVMAVAFDEGATEEKVEKESLAILDKYDINPDDYKKAMEELMPGEVAEAHTADGTAEESVQVPGTDSALRPANEVRGEHAQQGVIGGDFVQIIDGQDQVLHVRISDVQEEQLDGVYYEELQPLVATVRIENRSSADSDGLSFGLACDNVEGVDIFGDTTLDSYGQDLPAGSFVEGTMSLARPFGCEGARITATYPITYDGDDTTLSTGSWPLT